MTIKFSVGLVLTGLLLQACNAGPSSTRPEISGGTVRTAPLIASTTVSPDDQKYAALLQSLTHRNPNIEAEQAIAQDRHFLLGYYRGRAGLKLPGLEPEQQASQNCSIETIDGLGDVIHGENHLKYRVAIRNFAEIFNTKMLSNCL